MEHNFKLTDHEADLLQDLLHIAISKEQRDHLLMQRNGESEDMIADQREYLDRCNELRKKFWKTIGRTTSGASYK